ncbi:DMT family transporter [Gemmobacter sp.]|uniref:DMT family transporter n=1 Tax=Gemmobacter sp. TaxID=1898957 RepID=UPI002AFDF8C9|nr:DMT family transporter [Gemmobacter sp.]
MSESSVNRPVAGVLWMVLSGLCFVAVTGVVRFLGTDLPAPQSAFLRFGWAFLFLLPTLVPLIRAGLPQGAWPLVGLRGLVHMGAVSFWFYAMARIPVAEVTAIGFLNPIIVTLGAALFFGEKLALRRLSAIGIAVIGALVVLRPGLRELGSGQLAQVVAAFFFASSYLLAKRLSGMLPAGAIVALMSATVTIALMPVALSVWVPVTLEQLAWLGLVAAFATAGHYTMTRAFALAPVSVTQPVVFLQLVWATILGAAAFAEPVDPWILAGGALIIGAISYMTLREAQLKRAGVTPVAGADKI